MPKIDLSVIITNYNKPPEQVTECVDSLRQQTIIPKEIILVDDCSNPAAANGFCISILLPRNVGVARARDIGVKMSTGTLLLFIDADDKVAPDFIQQCSEVIAKKEIAYPNILTFGAVEKPELLMAPPKLTPNIIIGPKNRILVSSMMHRRVYEKLGGFDKSLPIYEDWDFWIRAMFNGCTFGRANTLLYYRQNPRSRNTQSLDFKTAIHRQITAPYIVIDGRLGRKETWEIKD